MLAFTCLYAFDLLKNSCAEVADIRKRFGLFSRIGRNFRKMPEPREVTSDLVARLGFDALVSRVMDYVMGMKHIHLRCLF